jgi:hypothetical protein
MPQSTASPVQNSTTTNITQLATIPPTVSQPITPSFLPISENSDDSNNSGDGDDENNSNNNDNDDDDRLITTEMMMTIVMMMTGVVMEMVVLQLLEAEALLHLQASPSSFNSINTEKLVLIDRLKNLIC